MKKFLLALALSVLLLIMTACSKAPMPASDAPLRDMPPAEPSVPVIPAENEDEATSEPPMPEVDPPKTTVSYLTVTCDALNVRTGPGTKFGACGLAERGTLLAFEGVEGGWFRTLYRGAEAYVSAKYAEPCLLGAGSEPVERVIAEGVKLLGAPYVYGAVRLHDGHGHLLGAFRGDVFDCSSLMQTIFYRGAGVLLDVTSRTQAVQGTPVPFEELERGDLLFFTNAARRYNAGIERIGHVALWLGDGYILHTASDYAKIEPLSAARRENFVTARRVL